MLFKSGVWESLSDFQFCGGGGNGRGKLTKCPNYFVRGCSWVVGDCYHTAQFFLFHAFFFTLYLGSFNDRSYDRVKGLRTRLKLRCFLEQFIPYYSIYVGTSHSGCALLRLLKLWLDKSVLAACRRASECTVLFVGLCVRAALERNMSPKIFLCLGTSWFCLCVLLLCLCVLVAVLLDFRCGMTSSKFTTEKQVVLAQSCGLPLISAQSARFFQAIEQSYLFPFWITRT